MGSFVSTPNSLSRDHINEIKDETAIQHGLTGSWLLKYNEKVENLPFLSFASPDS
jgi:hypothetical protein